MRRSQWLLGTLASALAVAACLLAPTPALAAEGQDMYRLYNPYSGEHLYTASAVEYATLGSIGWSREGVAWVAPTSGAEVWRLYNPYVKNGDHHYTKDANEYARLKELGWRQEGHAWFSGGDVELYRLYNPYAVTGTHHYTSDAHERDVLKQQGWRYEGTAWLGLEAGDPTKDVVSGTSDEEALRKSVTTSLELIKSLSDDSVDEIVGSLDDAGLTDTLKALGIDPAAFVRAVLGGFDYEVGAVTVSGDTAQVKVSVTSKSLATITKDIEAAAAKLPAGATPQQAGDAIMGAVRGSATHESSFTFKYKKVGGTWYPQNEDDFFDAVFA